MYVRTCTTYHQVMPVPDLPTTVLVGKYVDTATDSYFSAVFWCKQFFSMYVPLIKTLWQKSVYHERSVIRIVQYLAGGPVLNESLTEFASGS